MLYVQGTLHAEDHALRQIARKKVNIALQSIEQKTTRLLDSLLNKLTPQIERELSIETLLESIRTHPQVAMETAVIEHYSQAFPELQERVRDIRERIDSRARIRIEEALYPLQMSRRFRFTKGFNHH